MSSVHSIKHQCAAVDCDEEISYGPDEQFIFDDENWTDVTAADGQAAVVCPKHNEADLPD